MDPLCVDGIRFKEITKQNIRDLELFTVSVFPVHYDVDFYKSVLGGPVKFLAMDQKKVIGAVCAKVDQTGGERKVYITLLGVLALYRNRGLGTAMLLRILHFCEDEGSIACAQLHVQENNANARAFYKKFGFEEIREVKGFYRRTNCPTAILMEKSYRVQRR